MVAKGRTGGGQAYSVKTQPRYHESRRRHLAMTDDAQRIKRIMLKLAEERMRKKIPQRVVAEKLGVSHQTISLWEHGPITMRLIDLFTYAEAIDVDVRFMFRNKEDQ